MRILLINPPGIYDRSQAIPSYLPPVALAYIGPYLRKCGHEVTILDMNIRVLHDKNLLGRIREIGFDSLDEPLSGIETDKKLDTVLDELISMIDLKHDLICMSMHNVRDMLFSLHLCRKIKEASGKTVVVGGTAIEYDFVKKYDFIDYLIDEDGEIPLSILCEHINGKSDKPIPGLVSMDNGKITVNDTQKLEFASRDVDYKGFHLDLYKFVPASIFPGSNIGNILILGYNFMKGCKYACAFCLNSHKNERIESRKDIQTAVREIMGLSSRFKTRFFYFLNMYINFDKNYLNGFCDELIRSNINILWSDSAKPFMFDADLFRKMRKSGCIMLTFGMESGSDRILRKMRKQHDPKMMSSMLKMSHEAGIWNMVNIIVGFPGETEEDFEHTERFISDNLEYIDGISINKYVLTKSYMLQNPGEFGLVLSDTVQRDFYGNGDFWSYDYADGTKWEAIRETIQERFNRIHNKFEAKSQVDDINYPNNIYSLYNDYNDKTKVRKATRDGIVPNIFVGSACNNDCLHCQTKSSDQEFRCISPGEILSELMELRNRGYSSITFTGGEPTLHKDISKIIACSSRLGFSDIRMRTNARMLSYHEYATKIKKAGVRKIIVPVYGNSADIHDSITNAKGSYEQTKRGIKNWEALGGMVEIIRDASSFPK